MASKYLCKEAELDTKTITYMHLNKQKELLRELTGFIINS